jgi:hypothetical protein
VLGPDYLVEFLTTGLTEANGAHRDLPHGQGILGC